MKDRSKSKKTLFCPLKKQVALFVFLTERENCLKYKSACSIPFLNVLLSYQCLCLGTGGQRNQIIVND
jgi:hypothetical protein